MSNYGVLLAQLGLVEAHLPFVKEALTHSSSLNARGQKGGVSYERLEFLGDRVLGLGVAVLLQETFPDESEGAMALRHAYLTKESTLATVARAWGLGELVVLGSSERGNGGVEKDSILADTVEALLAVVWLAKGAAAMSLVKQVWGPLVKDSLVRDAKTALQEMVQAKKGPVPVYEVTGTSGPEHKRVFTVKVSCKLGEAEGSGKNKKEAETAAAAALLREKGPMA